MSKFGDFLFGRDIPDQRPALVKGVEVTNSNNDDFQRNLESARTVSIDRNVVSVRTITYGLSVGGGSYATMYRRQPAVRAVVDFLARNIGQLNPKVYIRASNTDRLEVSDHPLSVLLHRPNLGTTRYAFLRDTVSDLAVYDRAYWRKMYAGRARQLARLSPSAVQLETGPDGQRVYRLANGTVIPRAELVIFHGYSPEGGDDGVSPLETLRRVLEEEVAAVQARANQWVNGTQAGGFLLRPADAPEWSAAARERFQADFTASYSGAANAGRIPILEEGMTFAPGTSTFSAKDSDYIAGRRLTYEEVAIAYGVPPVLIGMGSDTKSNFDASHRMMYQDVLGPWLRMIQDEIELQLLPDFEPLGSSVYVEFNLAEKLKGSFEEQGKTLVTAVGVPYMTPNEGRARLNLPRIDDPAYDRPIQPLNVLYGGQPAVTVPTADPGTASMAPAVKALKRAVKVPEAALERRDRAARDHEDLFRKFFDRQRRALTSKAAPDRDRWDRELTADLYLLATQTTRTSGLLAAQQIDGVYDEKRTLAWLVENARIASESINQHTFDELEAAEDADEVRDVFEVATSSRAAQLGLSRATELIAFARVEAAKHSEDADGKQRTKTWVVTSTKSRHPDLNGQTVPVGENFSNGLAWPGAAGGGADEVAGCRCLLDLS